MADQKHKTVFELDVEMRKFATKMKEAEGTFGKLKNTFGALKATLATIFSAMAIRKIADTAIETSKLYGQALNLRRAFKRLAEQEGLQATELMKDLKEATFGAVTELELMKNATQAKFLGIDLNNLPILLKFATIRAKETGQNVDYLVQSIVTGIGRKSPLILDNLGLQIREINAEIEKIARSQGRWTGRIDESTQAMYIQQAAVNIAKKNIEEAGEKSAGASDKVNQLSNEFERFKILMGSIASGPTMKVLTLINETLKRLGATTEEILAEGLEKEIIATTKSIEESEKKLYEYLTTLKKLEEGYNSAGSAQKIFLFQQKKRIEELRKAIPFLQQEIINQKEYLEILQKQNEEELKAHKIKAEREKQRQKEIEQQEKINELLRQNPLLDKKIQKDFEVSAEEIREYGRTIADDYVDKVVMAGEKLDELAMSLGEALVSGFDTEGLKGALKNVLITIVNFLEKEMLAAQVGAGFRTIFGDPSGLIQLGITTALFESAKAAISSFEKGVENYQGGLAFVHKNELVQLPRGSNVYTKSETKKMMDNSETNNLLRELINISKNQSLSVKIKGSDLYTVLERDKRNRL